MHKIKPSCYHGPIERIHHMISYTTQNDVMIKCGKKANIECISPHIDVKEVKQINTVFFVFCKIAGFNDNDTLVLS